MLTHTSGWRWPQFQNGTQLFNAGNYFEAHEALEEVWREAPSDEKRFVQGLVQAAVGLHHFHAGNLMGARGVLARAVRNLEPHAPAHWGIAVEALVRSLREWLRCAEEGGEPPKRPRIERSGNDPRD